MCKPGIYAKNSFSIKTNWLSNLKKNFLKQQDIKGLNVAHTLQAQKQFPVFSECLLNAYFKLLEVKELYNSLGPYLLRNS